MTLPLRLSTSLVLGLLFFLSASLAEAAPLPAVWPSWIGEMDVVYVEQINLIEAASVPLSVMKKNPSHAAIPPVKESVENIQIPELPENWPQWIDVPYWIYVNEEN